MARADDPGGFHTALPILTAAITVAKGDDLKFVICNPLNPSQNKISCALFFHQVQWANASVG
jgi:hypothetical protein